MTAWRDRPKAFTITPHDTNPLPNIARRIYVGGTGAIWLRPQHPVDPTNEVQTLVISGSPEGGTFTISYAGQTTGNITFDDVAADIQTALEALSNLEVGDVVVAGGPLPDEEVTITFQGGLAERDVALMTTTDSLTGGTDPASAITTTTAGQGDVLYSAIPVGTYIYPTATHVRATGTTATLLIGEGW